MDRHLEIDSGGMRVFAAGANICVAVSATQIGNWYSYLYNDGIGVDCEQYVKLGV